jgi:AAA15 family ATPase/GTPase
MSELKQNVYIGTLNSLVPDFNSDEAVRLNKVNIIVGQNNSGKSRAMRGIATYMEKEKISGLMIDRDYFDYQLLIESLSGKVESDKSLGYLTLHGADLDSLLEAEWVIFKGSKEIYKNICFEPWISIIKSIAAKTSTLDEFKGLWMGFSRINEFQSLYDLHQFLNSFRDDFKQEFERMKINVFNGFFDFLRNTMGFYFNHVSVVLEDNALISHINQYVDAGKRHSAGVHKVNQFYFNADLDVEILKSLYLLNYVKKEERGVLFKNLSNFSSDLSEFVNNCTNLISKSVNVVSIVNEVIREIDDKFNFVDELSNRRLYYIPTLRGLRPLDMGQHNEKYQEGGRSFYKERTLLDYGMNGFDKKVEVFTGEDLYTRIHKLVCGATSERKQLREYEKYLAINFFSHLLLSDDARVEGVSLIPRYNQDVIDVKIGEREAFPIYNLGDGIQSIIILTYLIHTVKEPSVFLMEEPEVGLHPGMQRKLLEIWCANDRHQIFFTTHSNHFLDMSIDFSDISIINVRHDLSQDKFYISSSASVDKQILSQLGVSPSSVHLCNCVFLVEGISERITFRHWFELYQKSLPESERKFYMEDIHYAFVEYQGGNIAHWDFLDSDGMSSDSLFNDIFVIADADGAVFEDGTWIGGDKCERLNKLEALNKESDVFYGLRVRELENLHTPKCIEEFLLDKKGGSGLKFSNDLKLVWKTNYLGSLIHLMIAGRIFERGFKSEDKLIEFFGKSEPAGDGVAEKVDRYGVFETSMKQYGKFANPVKRKDSQGVERRLYLGTLTTDMKKKLAAFSADYYKKFDDLDEGAKELVTRMYDFVSRKNCLG